MTSASTMERVAAIVRRDIMVERSYHFQLALQVIGIGFSAGTFFFIGKLVGEPDALSDYEGGYFPFALIGSIVMTTSVLGLSTFSQKISDEQRAGTLEVLLSTPTRLGTILLGSFLVPLAFLLVELALYLVFALIVFGSALPWTSIVMALPVLLLLTIVVFSALGIFSATIIVLAKRGDPLAGLVAQSSNFLAGALFPVSLLPGWLQFFSHLVPAFYGLRAIRDLILANAGWGDVLGDVLALVAFAAVLLPSSMWAFSRAVRIARVTGTLGNY